ncbi:MAG: hypothetical protein JXA42_18120, partial [Anaerolineales bacterium]|nr:hypothetical protein [Anaerolineales bacterium]
QDGEMISSHDGPPMDGAYTTLAWLAGDLISDEHMLALPDALPPLPYQLRIGLYQRETDERPVVRDSQGEIPDRFITIPID